MPDARWGDAAPPAPRRDPETPVFERGDEIWKPRCFSTGSLISRPAWTLVRSCPTSRTTSQHADRAPFPHNPRSGAVAVPRGTRHGGPRSTLGEK